MHIIDGMAPAMMHHLITTSAEQGVFDNLFLHSGAAVTKLLATAHAVPKCAFLDTIATLELEGIFTSSITEPHGVS